MQAWALLAVSSDAQAETIKDQRAWAVHTAKEKGWHIARFIEGVASGKNGPRRLVRELLLDLRNLTPEQRPSWLLMIRLDRVGRGSIVESQVAVHDLKQLGVRVWTRDAGEVRLDNAMDALIVAVQSAVATHENEVRIDKARNVYKRKRLNGQTVGNKRPYGLRLGKDGMDEPDGKLAEVIKLAFKLRIQGLGYPAIGERLAEIAPPREYKSPKNGPIVVRWVPNRVKGLLENRAYVGPIIDELTFHRAQQVTEQMGRYHGKRKYPWPLSGVVRCYCGRALVGHASGRPTQRIRYYECHASWHHDGKYRYCRADELEDQFLAFLKRLRSTESQATRYRLSAVSDSPELLERGLREAKRELDTIDKAKSSVWELHAKGLVRDADVQARLDELAAKRTTIQERLVGIERQMEIAKAAMFKDRDADKLLRLAATTFVKVGPEDQRRLVRAVAIAVGGLYFAKDGTLQRGRVEDPGRQRNRRPNEL